MPSDRTEPPIDSLSLGALIDWCQRGGIDPYPIMAEELRKLGYTVTPPQTGPYEEWP